MVTSGSAIRLKVYEVREVSDRKVPVTLDTPGPWYTCSTKILLFYNINELLQDINTQVNGGSCLPEPSYGRINGTCHKADRKLFRKCPCFGITLDKPSFEISRFRFPNTCDCLIWDETFLLSYWRTTLSVRIWRVKLPVLVGENQTEYCRTMYLCAMYIPTLRKSASAEVRCTLSASSFPGIITIQLYWADITPASPTTASRPVYTAYPASAATCSSRISQISFLFKSCSWIILILFSGLLSHERLVYNKIIRGVGMTVSRLDSK